LGIHPRSGDQSRIRAVAVRQQGAFGSFEDDAAIPASQGFVGTQFFGSFRQQPAVHPGQLNVWVTILARKFKMHDRRRGEAVRYFRLLEESTPYCAHTAFHFRRIIDRKDAEGRVEEDRKSTRLNSSHVKISYAVFCLKKKIQLTKPGYDATTFT